MAEPRRTEAANLFERVLVPLTRSENSLAVAKVAIHLARAQGSSLILAFVADQSVRDLVARMTHRPADEVEQELEESGRRHLEHAAAHARREGVPVETALRVGMTYPELAAEARERGVTLIVVGRPVEHELRGLFESRLVRQLIEDACCSVLVLQPVEDR
jgi:nucleotide-binding universal stress UspA family protein